MTKANKIIGLIRETEDGSICVFDFNGYTAGPGHFPVAMWADYFPNEGVVKFGGDWEDIPDWHVSEEPTEEEVEKNAELKRLFMSGEDIVLN
jgi:hypothetical protein